jgi:hypothetical protein
MDTFSTQLGSLSMRNEEQFERVLQSRKGLTERRDVYERKLEASLAAMGQAR